MAHLTLPRSPVWPELSPARLHYRERGDGPAVLLLHGGWGEANYRWDAAMEALAGAGCRAVALDRTGYGRSAAPPEGAALPDDFHRRMAEETLLALDALDLPAAALWGHSDGAVVAAWAALLAPARVRALVLEALHVTPAKARSLEFFRAGVEAPEVLGPAAVASLEADHGARWREVLGRGARAWLRLIDAGLRHGGDLYGGRLAEVRAPTLLLHGRHDPRTEPGELDAARRALPHAELALMDAGHCPHASAQAAAESIAAAVRFLVARR